MRMATNFSIVQARREFDCGRKDLLRTIGGAKRGGPADSGVEPTGGLALSLHEFNNLNYVYVYYSVL
jgi:hypothetical protein